MATKATRGGIETRHARGCAYGIDEKRCNCTPTYRAWVWSRREGKKIRKTFPGDLPAAKTWVADADKGLRTGVLRTASRLTLREAAAAWIDGAREGAIHGRGHQPYKPSVIRSYETSLRIHVLPELGDYRLAELTLPDLQVFVNRMVAQKMGASLIRNALNPLRAIYRHAAAVGDVAVNPCPGLQVPSAKGKRDRIASPVEAEKLIDALPEGDQALWAAAFYSGLRRGELLALRCSDVRVKDGLISVERGWDQVVGPIEPKSAKGRRTVPIPALLSKRLAAHMLANGRSGSDLIFGTTKDRPFTPNLVNDRAQAAWDKAELERIGMHEARHTYVSLMSAAGVSLEVIGDYVGHSATAMTERYRHLLPGSHDDSRAKLDALLAAAKG